MIIKNIKKIQVIEKELEKSEEYINIDAKMKDKAKTDINELNILNDMHKKKIENLNYEINDRDTLINELNTLKDTRKQEIKNLRYQLNFKNSDQEPKSRKRADQEPKSRKKMIIKEKNTLIYLFFCLN